MVMRWQRKHPLRLAFRAREGGGGGVLTENPSVSQFVRGRGWWWCVDRGNTPSISRFKRGRGVEGVCWQRTPPSRILCEGGVKGVDASRRRETFSSSCWFCQLLVSKLNWNKNHCRRTLYAYVLMLKTSINARFRGVMGLTEERWEKPVLCWCRFERSLNTNPNPSTRGVGTGFRRVQTWQPGPVPWATRDLYPYGLSYPRYSLAFLGSWDNDLAYTCFSQFFAKSCRSPVEFGTGIQWTPR